MISGFGCGDRTCTCDLRDMSPTSCYCSTPLKLVPGRRVSQPTPNEGKDAHFPFMRLHCLASPNDERAFIQFTDSIRCMFFFRLGFSTYQTGSSASFNPWAMIRQAMSLRRQSVASEMRK